MSLSVSALESLLGSCRAARTSASRSTPSRALPRRASLDLDISSVTGGAVPTYDVDLAQDLLVALGGIAPVSSTFRACWAPTRRST